MEHKGVRHQTITEHVNKVKKNLTKKEKEAIISKYDARNRKMIRGQFKTYGIKGEKEIMLTYKIEPGNVHSKLVKDGDIVTLPFGYIKYLNHHGSIKREVAAGMMHTENGTYERTPIRVEDNEKRYEVRVLDVLSAEELEELEPSVLVKATIDDRAVR